MVEKVPGKNEVTVTLRQAATKLGTSERMVLQMLYRRELRGGWYVKPGAVQKTWWVSADALAEALAG